MNILYITTVFPKPEKGSTIYTDLAECLNERGHKMVVVMADPYVETSMNIERNMEVLRIKVKPYYNVNYFKKGLASLTMNKKIIQGIKKHLNNDFDFILFESPPITIASVVEWAMKKYKCPSYLMLKDIFPQNGADIGLFKKNGIIFNYFQKKEQNLYAVTSRIGCMSEGNKKYLLINNNISEDKVEIFPNTKKISNRKMKNEKDDILRKKYSIPTSAVVFLFGGNMGKPQALDFLAEAIIRLKDDNKIFFLLIGRGSEKERIRGILDKKGKKNYLMLENLPREEYEQFAVEADAGLILLDYRFTIPNFPSRILSYMELSMPVLAATDRVSDLPELIRDASCGLVCYSNDIEKFVENIKLLSLNRALRKTMGESGRNYIEKNLDITISANILETHFK